MNIPRLQYHLIDVRYLKKDISEKNIQLRTTQNPEEKEKLKSEIQKCYAEISKIVLLVEKEQEKLLAEEAIDTQVEELNLSERQLSHHIRTTKAILRTAKAFQKLVNTPTVLKNIRRRT